MKLKLLAVSVPSIARRHLIRALTLVVALTLASRAQAAFHLWNITQIYSNSSGTLQFIEMVGLSDFQNALSFGQPITVTDTSGTLHHTFSPSDLSSSSTNGKSLLFGTSGLHAAGGPTPDFIIPNNFLFTSGGTIDFFGTSGTTNDLTYPALPTDGIHALTYPSGPTVVNSPVNFAGQPGQVVPEPAAITLAAIGGICGISIFLRRRRG